MNNEQAGVIIRDIFARVELETGESERELLSGRTRLLAIARCLEIFEGNACESNWTERGKGEREREREEKQKEDEGTGEKAEKGKSVSEKRITRRAD